MPKKSENEKVRQFRDTYKELESVYDQFPKLCGLSRTEYWALTMIYEGVSTQSGISDHLLLSRQTVNSAFRQLRKKGMVQLEAKDDNLRVKQVYLTDQGQEFVGHELSQIHEMEEDVWGQMEESEQEELTRLLNKYKELLSKAVEEFQKKNQSSEDLQS